MTLQDEIISTVSHEMRTPLTSIRGFSQTLLNSWDKLDDDNKKKFIKIIEEQSNRLINLVENILTVSKENSDTFVLKKVNVNNIIEKTLPLLIEKYKTHHFSFNKDKNLLQSNLDEDKFQQIVTNLLDNAGKYSEEGTNVTVSTELQGEYVIIKIADQGVGIKEEDFAKLFKKFSRIENHLTSKTQGNGLGLYITKNLVEKMGGQISLTSQISKGTEFQIKFPVYNPEEVLKCSQES